MRIDAIQIGERVRKDMGDLKTLADSLKRHGLLHPVVVKKDNTLVAGHRRIEAARLIGWNEIPATVIDVEDLLSAERDENTERKAFTPTEAVAIGRLIEQQHKSKINERRHDFAVAAGKKRQGISVDTKFDPAGKTGTAVGKAVGLSSMSYYRAKTVVDAAESDPEKFGDLAEQMDATGNVSGAHEEMKRRKGVTGNGKQPRHPVHKKTHYPKADRTVERSTWALSGICDSLDTVNAAELDKTKLGKWIESLKQSAAHINRTTKRFLNG